MRSSVSFSRAAPSTSDPVPDGRKPKASPAWLRILPLVFLGMVGLVVLALLVAPPALQPQIGVFTQLASMLVCLGCALWIALRVPRGREKSGWLIVTLAVFLYALGDGVIIWLVAQNFPPEQISLADAFFLPLAPLLAVGAILFPPTRSTPAKQVRVILDVCIVVGAFFGVALVYLIIPRVTAGTLPDFIFVAYPVLDLVLLLTLIVLFVRGVQPAYRPVLFWFAVGMLCLIYADTMFNYFSLPFHVGPSYIPGTYYIDPFWVAAALSFSLAPLSLLQQQDDRPFVGRFDRVVERLARLQPSGVPSQLLLLLLPALVLFGLLAITAIFPAQEPALLPLVLVTLLVVILIIARQILTMRDLVDARIATERAEQLDALKDQFITSVNHELRTPLMTMTGYIDILADPDAQVSSEKHRQMIEYASRAGNNLTTLVKSILDTRRIEDEARNITCEAVNLKEAIEAALSLIDVREANPAGRRLQIQVPGHLVVWGDRVRVQQILTNLLSNAIKYSPRDMPIAVTARLVTEKNTRVLGLGTGRQGPVQMAEITVRDWGLGIPPEQRDLLFRRFVRLPRDIASNVRGTGLGLYLCRVFAEAMGGRIWIESTGVEGEGSTFHLRLPIPIEEPMRTLYAEHKAVY